MTGHEKAPCIATGGDLRVLYELILARDLNKTSGNIVSGVEAQPSVVLALDQHNHILALDCSNGALERATLAVVGELHDAADAKFALDLTSQLCPGMNQSLANASELLGGEVAEHDTLNNLLIRGHL